MQQGIQQDRHADLRTGGREASSCDFHRVTGREWLDTVDGSAPYETKDETTSTLEARYVGASDTLGTSSRISWKRTLGSRLTVVHLDWLAPYRGAARDERLRREQLESNHRENWAKGKDETDHRRHKHSPQKRRNGGTSVGYSRRRALRRKQRSMETRC
jgi:hypothetical protein